MKRKPIKRNLSPLNYSQFFREVTERDVDCVMCAQHPDDRETCNDRSAGIYDAHHVIPQQLLKREFVAEGLKAALGDPRNGVLVRRWHHDMLEARMRELAIPPRVAEFAADYGLDWWIERQAGEMAA